MSASEPTLTESPVPLALARLQGRPGRMPRGMRTHRPSLPLASLQEAIDETPRRFSEEPYPPDTDDEETFTEPVVVIKRSPSSSNGRRASEATFAERYRKLTEFDDPPLDTPRRASLAVPVGADGYGPSDKGRRRSWAARLQLERKKRRKSGGNDTDEESDTPTYTRQKRPSWWNVFVPDNMLKHRSRRASQQLSRSAESIDQAYKRSKSRSVDHGFAAPFDLDSLRSKVEGRFDAVNRDEDEQIKRLPPPPPIKTTTYTVRDRDTLTSLAARFDTTPSELTKLNRLATQFIFPGQTLLVPDKRKDGDKDSDGPSESGDNTSESTQGAPSEPAQEKEILDSLRPVSPEAPASSSAPQRFLKINVRHITDGQGVVSGVLLVTPNAVMFDPNVSDTLVMEHGPESYGVIAPMEYVVNAAIFYDIAHMRTHGPDHNAHKAEQAEIYYMSKSEHSPGKDSLLVKDETFPELQAAGGEGGAAAADERPASLDTEERGGAAFPKAFDRDLVTPTPLQQLTTEERRKSLLDHHWAIPSKDRMSIDQGSEVSSSADQGKEESLEASIAEGSEAERSGSAAEGAEGDVEEPRGDAAHLVKLSYHDSGIDIRDPLLHVNTANSKKVYSDADIVLSADWVPPVCLPRTEPPLSAPPLGENERAPRKPAAVSFSLDGTQKEDPGKPDKKNKMLKRLSYPLSWVEGLTGEAPQGSQSDSLPSSADTQNSTSVFSKVFNRRSSLGGFGRSHTKPSSATQPRLDYRSMVSVDDMPDLFASFDKLIPRPARPSDDPPLYLRLRMGKPAGRPLPRSTPLMSYGRKRMKPEYWFGIPRNRVDDLFKFLTHWVPERYGPLRDVAAHGYELIDSDTEWDDDDAKPGHKERSGSTGDVSDITRESWELLKAPYVKIYSIMKSQAEALGDSLGEEPQPEVLSMSDELRRALYSSGASVDMEFSPPDLIGTSEIFTMEHREKLCSVLPARAQGYMWSLAFSTSQHGFSLASMYRKMQRVDSPVLLVIQDTDNNVFGALTSCAFRPSEHFYGTGESLLFSFQRVEESRRSQPSPDDGQKEDKDDIKDNKDGNYRDETELAKTKFKYWGWTGDNMYFIRGSNDNISIGAGDGKFGLWLDGDLYLGRTQRCTTYGNDPLTTREDFVVKIMECWTFI
ncbi:oxidation resistance protein 1 isoform X1 [Nymphalis io]|uniref:oxidation resistance protein 1 isoform X1 n=2 Tax=Inachis io TaxID=171585 RepID=UPI0021671162|nr:oxidation resistance protein 1 isoform X1 [Nymphalis io]XP_050351728.1 oxidation resistance protein 1 isoform X1 [Nymphalis io]XP_050351736.1 oxidation resistance protein 1 isoform X1 [Nymphalis io]XP_050351744.1 oxidation resistance protein 1 isoform X1 [Nymphalis io]XP_050351752.1 oxidation resistance protein 1 isoform X1 [Nymphalis io]XP_050351760.1 oxidation resistance protein 1 isoform X1 [Nymphalis io]